jgi:hypothetical protein
VEGLTGPSALDLAEPSLAVPRVDAIVPVRGRVTDHGRVVIQPGDQDGLAVAEVR